MENQEELFKVHGNRPKERFHPPPVPLKTPHSPPTSRIASQLSKRRAWSGHSPSFFRILYVVLGINLFCVIAYAQTDEKSKVFSDDKAYNLIRSLLKQRIYSDPLLKKEYMSGNVPKVESLPEMVLLGLPEGTIVTIVEKYLTKKKDSSLSEEMILYSIEEHRKILFPESGIMPTPLTLSSYIRYRLKIEHSHGVGITTDFINTAIKRATEVSR